MISLKESILRSTNAGITGVISEKIKDLIEKLNADTRTDNSPPITLDIFRLCPFEKHSI